jgi:glycosyltransferase involved in cell wall biosynthesis
MNPAVLGIPGERTMPFGLQGISDEYLEQVYAPSTCLIAASYGEGFGLPLIEAAQYKLPIIARDIPVFHEVAGEQAFYLNDKAPGDLVQAITVWLRQYEAEKHPTSGKMPWLTWKENAAQLMQVMLGNGTSVGLCADPFAT